MTSDSPETDPSTRTTSATLIQVLTRLFEAVGQDFSPAELAEKCAEQSARPAVAESTSASDSVRDRLDVLAHVGHDAGLRTHTAVATVADALKVVRAGQPLVATDELGRRWCVIRLGRGGRIEIHSIGADFQGDPGQEVHLKRASEKEILSLLGVGEEAEVHWLVASSSTPNAAATQTESGKALTNFQRLRLLLAPERGDILVVLIFAITIGVFMLATPIAVQAIVNLVSQGGTIQPLVSVVIFLALALIFLSTLFGIQTWVVELMQRRLFVRAVADLAARLPRVESTEYDTGFGPERVNRFFDVVTVQKAVAKLLIDGLGVLLGIVVGLTVLAFYHPFLLAFDVVLLLVIAIIVFGPVRRGERTAIVESTAKYKVAAWLQEIARSPLAFRAAGADTWINEKADALSRDWVAARTGHFKTLMAQIVGALALQVVASTSLLAIGGYLVLQGSLTLGQLVAAELIVSAVVFSVAKMGKQMETWYDLMAAVAKVGSLLDLPIESSHGEHHAQAQHQLSGPRPSGQAVGRKLELLGVTFKSTTCPTQFDRIDLEIEAGERVLIRGLDGASRLAMVDLIWRLRHPTSGVIRLEERDIRDLAPDFLRREVAVVSQVEVVHGTVRDNVRLRRPFVLNDDVRSALACVGLREIFAEFEGGLDAVMHPDARILSDDDLRRLMVARALAGDPGVLVIDSGGGSGSKFWHAISQVLARKDGRTVIVLTNDGGDSDGYDRIIDLQPADVKSLGQASSAS